MADEAVPPQVRNPVRILARLEDSLAADAEAAAQRPEVVARAAVGRTLAPSLATRRKWSRLRARRQKKRSLAPGCPRHLRRDW